MKDMAVHEVTEDERIELMRRTLTNAAEITEAFKALIEDDLHYDVDEALAMLDELLNCIKSVNADLEPVEIEEDTGISKVTWQRPVKLADDTVDDGIN